MNTPFEQTVRRIQHAFRENTDRSFTCRQMYKHLGIKDDQGKQMVRKIMQEMAAQGVLREIKEGKYRLDPDYAETQQDRHGDRLTDQEQQPIIGTIILTNTGGIVCGISDKNMRDNVLVRATHLHGARDGEKVVVRLLRAGTGRRLPEGEVVERLGQAGDNDTEMHAILTEYGLPYSYPEELEQQANLIDDDINAKELSRREDFRDRLTFTIDPKDAKDFDDALSFRLLTEPSEPTPNTEPTTDPTEQEKQIYEVGVHIADVTHYVAAGSDIDKEAYHRGTSIYLVDRTIPMLPEHLSNELCSLRADEDKLCMSVIFMLDDQAHVLQQRIRQTVIRSSRRFNYDEVQERLTQPEQEANEQLRTALTTLNRLAQTLRRQRFDKGAIRFEREEMRFQIDEQGKPVSVFLREQTDANNLIEEFMLLANKTVAETMKQKEFVYRIHDVPDPDKLESLGRFIQRFGYRFKAQSTRKETITKNINLLLSQAQGKAEQNLIETLTIRSMAKACYSTENIGHYGLAFRYYTHFTSPIRRYPDMMVHRLLRQALFEEKKNTVAVFAKDLEEACDHCSKTEQTAQQAERASVKYKQAEFLQDKIGLVFDGHISGVTEHGLYVQLDDNFCEGFVPLRFIFSNDYAVYDEDNYCIYGERTTTKYTLGDSVVVRIIDVNLDRKQVDLQIV